MVISAVFAFRILSSLPDVGNLMISGPSQDITILTIAPADHRKRAVLPKAPW